MKKVIGVASLIAMASFANAFAEKSVSASDVADVMECAYSDRANLNVLQNLNAKPSKAQKKLAKRLAKFDVFLSDLSTQETSLGEAEVEARRLARKEKRANMSAVELAVSSAKSKPPCESAEKITKKVKVNG
jgi:hypothetical protein